MTQRRNYQEVGKIELAPEEAARFEKRIEEADREIEAARVNFRWGAEQLNVVKRAAELAGIPYQTYIKQVVYWKAVHDIKDAESLKTSSKVGG